MDVAHFQNAVIQKKNELLYVITMNVSKEYECMGEKRAKETARHISEMTGIPMEIEPRLIEQNFGKYESTPRDGAEFHEAKKDMASRFGTGESMLRDIA